MQLLTFILTDSFEYKQLNILRHTVFYISISFDAKCARMLFVQFDLNNFFFVVVGILVAVKFIVPSFMFALCFVVFFFLCVTVSMVLIQWRMLGVEPQKVYFHVHFSLLTLNACIRLERQ